MSRQENSYKHIFKTASLFGSVQFLNIIFSVIRTKAGAFFLGVEGFGIIGLLNSSINLISQIVKIGIDTTTVKEISQSKTNEGFNQTLGLVKKILLYISVSGFFITIILSPVMSYFTFGNNTYSWSFVILSIAVFSNIYSSGLKAIIQGKRKYKILAKANIFIGLTSVLLTVTLYCFLGVRAIVYSILSTSILSLLISLLYFNFSFKNIPKIKLSKKELHSKSKNILKLGFYLSLVGIASLISDYLFRVFLRYYSGNILDVGYYQASFIIINTYIGIVFSALRTDYFPRLTAEHNNRNLLLDIINKQAKVTLLIITPIAIIFISFVSLIIKILYSKDFLVINELLTWTMLGVIFRTASFTLGYVLLAKNESSIFLKTTIFFNCIFLLSSVIGYYYLNLNGIGIAYFIYYIAHLIGIGYIVYKRYNLFLTTDFYILFFKCFTIVVLTKILNSYSTNNYIFYSIQILFLTLSIIYIYKEINKLIDIKKSLYDFIKK